MRAPEPIQLSEQQADWMLNRIVELIAQDRRENCQPILDRAQSDVNRLQEANAELKGLNGAQSERIAELQRLLKERT